MEVLKISVDTTTAAYKSSTLLDIDCGRTFAFGHLLQDAVEMFNRSFPLEQCQQLSHRWLGQAHVQQVGDSLLLRPVEQ